MSAAVSTESLLRQLHWRYATKKFDSSRKISDEDWQTLEQSLLLEKLYFLVFLVGLIQRLHFRGPTAEQSIEPERQGGKLVLRIADDFLNKTVEENAVTLNQKRSPRNALDDRV